MVSWLGGLARWIIVGVGIDVAHHGHSHVCQSYEILDIPAILAVLVG